MKAESNIKPVALSVEKCAGDIAEVIFRENIKSEQREEETVYTYDEYRTAVPYRDNLLATVKKSKAAWFARAKADEAEAAVHKPTLAEQVAELAAENAKLREENETIGAALEETIAIVLGGEE